MQALPSKELAHIIKHYLFLENRTIAAGSIRLFADGHTGIVFSLQTPLITASQNSVSTGCLPENFLYGQVNRYRDIRTENGLAIIIVVLHPAGATQLTGIPASVLRENIIDATTIWGRGVTSLREQLMAALSIKHKCTLLNTYFIQLLAGNQRPEHLLIGASLQYIAAGKGLHSIEKLVQYTGYTERHLDRKFNDNIGLSPKTYSSITQLHYFLGLLKNAAAGTSYTSLAYEAGYADQSHLIKAFKKLQV